MKIISWNVNGLRAVYKKGFISWVRKANPDILCLQEIKAHPEQLPKELTDFKDYHEFFNSADRKGYSGVAIYTKQEPQEVIKGLGNKKYNGEGRVLTVKYADFTLLNVYFPNGKASDVRLKYKMGFYEAFLKYIEDLRKNGEKIVFCGDVNTAHKEIDLARPGPNSKISGFLPKERAWIDKVVKKGYVDTFRMFEKGAEHYSWWSYMGGARERNVGWRIDYFFVAKELKKNVKSAGILSDVMGSDHCPIELELDC